MPQLSIIYTYRNRDTARIKASLESLARQISQSFEVVFVDYGSQEDYAEEVKAVVEFYAFANYHYIGHPGLLWCKARALNYGIRQAKSEAVFIADADVVFHPEFASKVYGLDLKESFYLLDIAYLGPEITPKEILNIDFNQRKHKFIHDTFGVALFSKQALIDVNGLDTFFHFYGSEDEDLNRRLQHAGYLKDKVEGLFIQHIWHERYPQLKDTRYTLQPRVFNIMRINQNHMFFNDENQISRAVNGIDNTTYYMAQDLKRLEYPEKQITITNKSASVDHSIYYELDLALQKFQSVQLVITASTVPDSHKYIIKKTLSKTVQPYYSFKTVNDILLKHILFNYRDHNYAFELTQNPNQLRFTLENKAYGC